MELEDAVHSLLVQLSKLQVALLDVTSERDALKTQLAEQTKSQQQCLQLLLVTKEQLQQFQVAMCSIRRNNEQLMAHNLRLQRQLQQLQHHTPQQPAQRSPSLSRKANNQLPLLLNLGHSWLGCKNAEASTYSSCVSSLTDCCDQSSSNDGCSDTYSCSGDGSLDDSHCGSGVGLSGTAAAADPYFLTANQHTVDHSIQLMHDLGCRATQESLALQQQQPWPSSTAAGTAGEHSPGAACSPPIDTGTLARHSGSETGAAAVCLAASLATEANLPELAQPTQQQVSTQPRQQYKVSCKESAIMTESNESSACITLTQQQLDYILNDIQHLQQQLAQTTAKLDTVLLQSTPVVSSNDSQQDQQSHQQQLQLRRAEQVPLQVGDQSIVQWYAQLRIKQQQMPHRQQRQQLLGMQPPTAEPAKLGGRNRCNRAVLACTARSYNQLDRSVGKHAAGDRPPWNYQNHQLRTQQQRQRRRLQHSVLQEPQMKHMPTAADNYLQDAPQAVEQCQQETLQQQQIQEVKERVSPHGLARTEPSVDAQSDIAHGLKTVDGHEAAAAVAPAAAPLESCDKQNKHEEVHSSPQPEGSWVSSASNDRDEAGEGAVFFMQPTSMRCAAVVKAHGLL